MAPARPLVVAHRGASHAVAEHTLSAYVAAIESGADALECDVRLTRDEHLVCVHDRTVDRTSDGRGVVSELDLAGLEALDFSSWHDWADATDRLRRDEPYLAGVAPDRDHRGDVLTLDTLLGLVRDTPRPVRLLVETKHPTRYSGLVEKELVGLLNRFGMADDSGAATVMSFSPIALRRVRLLAPKIPTVLLMDRLLPVRRAGALPSGVHIAGPGLSAVQADPDVVRRIRGRGHQVYVWTVDEPDDVDFVLDLGVDALITNRPAQVLHRLGPP